MEGTANILLRISKQNIRSLSLLVGTTVDIDNAGYIQYLVQFGYSAMGVTHMDQDDV